MKWASPISPACLFCLAGWLMRCVLIKCLLCLYERPGWQGTGCFSQDFGKWVSTASYINKTKIWKGTKVLAETSQQNGPAQLTEVTHHRRDPLNQHFDRSDQEKWSTFLGGPVFRNFLVGLNRSIEFWTKIFCKLWLNGSRPMCKQALRLLI